MTVQGRPEGKRVLILEHEPKAPAGSLGDWAEARGFELEVLPSQEDWEVPELDESVAFLASLGSPDASYDDSLPWLARELEVLSSAAAADVPVLGICFGAQSLARSLGAPTRRAEETEVGWYEIESRDQSLVPPGPWFFWHEDRFDVPPGANLLATSAAGPAAFRSGRSLGLQFHPEVRSWSVDHWIAKVGADLSEATVAAMRRPFEQEAERVDERSWELYDAFLASVSR